MRTSITLVVCVSFLPAIAYSSVSGCKKDDANLNNCVIKTLNSLLPTIINGNKKYAIPSLDPFSITTLSLSDKTNDALALDLEFTDIKVFGIKDAKIVEGTKVDLQKKRFEIRIFLPLLIMKSKYVIDGKILLLPIKGSGDANLTVGQLEVEFDSDFTLEQLRDGKKFAQLKNANMDFTFKSFNLYLANLFNGDKALGETTNKFLNENWREVMDTFKPALRQTIKQIIFLVVNNIANHVSFDTLFPN